MDTCMATTMIKTGHSNALRLAHAPPTQHLQEGPMPTALALLTLNIVTGCWDLVPHVPRVHLFSFFQRGS